MRTLRTNHFIKTVLLTMVTAMAWLSVGPAWGASHQAEVQARAQARWEIAHRPRPFLAPGLTDTPGPALRAKIAARQAARPAPDVRPLSPAEMRRARGRGAFRNPYFAGSPMPWQRAFRDVNLCDGNLFKSFTDVQVAPARGAGLVLQRTYNSDDARVGPFGVGWTHAYDIRIQEAADVLAQSGNSNAKDMSATGPAAADALNDVPRTDFFGHKHTYHRDADGLYSPPAYLFDETKSDYDTQLVDGPTKVLDDTETGMDGTVKHYVNVVTLADGTEGNERACDYIQDRYGNKTTLTYGLSYAQEDGSTRQLLTQVTDPVGRSLVFTWANLGTASQPAYRVTQVQGPLVGGQAVPGVTYRVVYNYYTDPNESNAANDLYNLRSVTLDPDGLARTTTYTYTGLSGTYADQTGNQQTATENGLLASITDPVGNVVSYQYNVSYTNGGSSFNVIKTPNRLWVSQITEPGGTGPHVWTLATDGYFIDLPLFGLTTGWQNGYYIDFAFGADTDQQMRADDDGTGDGHGESSYGFVYDAENNVTATGTDLDGADYLQFSTYGQHGNLLTQNAGYSDASGNDVPWPHGTVNTYYNASQYFAKATATDALGHLTSYGVGTDTAGNPGDPDPNVGDRGQVLWVRDPGYAVSGSPSYGKQFTYSYNAYGQKTRQTDLNGVVTTYTYGDQWGNLTQVVQDPGGLNRTTTMSYDAAGRVTSSTDPLGQASTFTYNTLGQPVSVATPARGSAPPETIAYAYDANGRTHSVTDNRGPTVMAYVPGSDLVASVADPATGAVSYTYGPWGERLSMTLPGGGTWHYAYATAVDNTGTDPYGRLATNGSNRYYQLPDPGDLNSVRRTLLGITDDQGRPVSYTYTDAGKLTGALSDMVFSGAAPSAPGLVSYAQTQCAYISTNSNYQTPPCPPLGQLTNLATVWSYVGPDRSQSQPSKLLSQSAYTYDDDGQRLTNTVSAQQLDAAGHGVVDGSGNPVLSARQETYSYDALNRLKTVDYGDGQTQGYAFDAMGNRLSRQDSAAGTTNYGYNHANMLLTAGGSGYTSDADGNTLSGGGRSMTWDSQNRMTSCTANGSTATFTYGADGLRRSMTVNGVTTYYVYDGQSLVREMQGAPGSLHATATYLTGPRGPEYRRDDTRTEADGQGHTFGVTRWYVYDGLGSVVGEVDPLGNVTTTTGYDVYGAKRVSGGTASSRQGFVGALGHLSDAATGLVYMRARYYDPATGRFASEDPGKNGNNWFVYADNNPTNEVDKDGKVAALVVAAVLGAVFAVIFYMAYQDATGQQITMTGAIEAGAAGAIGGVAVLLVGWVGEAAGITGVASLTNSTMTLAEFGIASALLGGLGAITGAACGIAFPAIASSLHESIALAATIESMDMD